MTITSTLAGEILYQHMQYNAKAENVLSNHFFNGNDFSLEELSNKLDAIKEEELQSLLEKVFF